jgi:hypothetical protein
MECRIGKFVTKKILELFTKNFICKKVGRAIAGDCRQAEI